MRASHRPCQQVGEFFENVPLDAGDGFVVVSVGVGSSNGELVVVLVDGTRRTSTLVGHEDGRNVQLCRPSD